jgi:hypothetical protein
VGDTHSLPRRCRSFSNQRTLLLSARCRTFRRPFQAELDSHPCLDRSEQRRSQSYRRDAFR